MKAIESKIQKTIKQHKLLSPCDHVLVALSGGADSVVLLHVLKGLGYKLSAAHINPMIRGDEALRDERFVIDLCEELEVPLKIYHKNCPVFAAENKLSLEEAARIMRYEALEDAAYASCCPKIATAHTENDNIETMLMRLIRGTSPYGLRGIDVMRGKIIRPLLSISRDEIIEYIAYHKLSYVSDTTNKDTNYLRNRVRRNLLVDLRSNYNPNINAALSRLSANLKTDADYFDKELDRICDDYVVFKEAAAGIDAKAVSELHPAVLERLIRRCVKFAAGTDKDFDHVHNKMVLGLFCMNSGKRLNLPGGLAVSNSFGSVFIYKEKYDKPAEITLRQGDFVQAGDSGYFISLSSEKIYFRENFVNACTGVFVCDKITDSLVLRGRRDGDIITMQDGKVIKLKDFLIRQKMPAFVRDYIYVAACENKVLMVLTKEPYAAFEPGLTSPCKMHIGLWRKLKDNG